MAAIPYAFYPHATTFPFPSLLLLYLFHECYLFAVISEYETKKIKNTETFLVKSRKESSIYI